MNGTFFYIGLGGGLAAACGLRPYLPALLAGALASADALGVRFTHHFHFLQAPWWLLVVTVALVLCYVLQLVLADGRAGRIASDSVDAQALGVGALLFAGTLAAHNDAWWPGLIAGGALAWLARAAARPVLAGARARLRDRAAREALSVYLDAVSLLLAALVVVLHPLGYVLVALLMWFIWRRRGRSDEKYAGLRILRR